MTSHCAGETELLWYWQGPVSRYYRPDPAWRSSRELTLWLLMRGRVTLVWDGGTRQVGAGHWIVPPPRRRNEVFSPGARVRSLRFRADLPDGRMRLCPREPFVAAHCPGEDLELALDALAVTLRDRLGLHPGTKTVLPALRVPVGTGLALNAHAHACLSALWDRMEAEGFPLGSEPLAHPALTAALGLLASRDLRQPLRESWLAGAAGISLPHLRRLFRKEVGFTIKDWDGMRLEAEVKQRLREGKRSCKEIAFAHGFSSTSHFCRWFKARMGSTPGEWTEGHYGGGASRAGIQGL